MARIFINKNGEYLAWYPVNSHAPHQQYSAYWTKDINQASLEKSIILVDRISWKGVNPVPFIIASLPAEEQRKVTIIQEEVT